MKQRQQCARVRAYARAFLQALQMRDGDLSGPARSGTSKQAEDRFTTKRDILESQLLDLSVLFVFFQFSVFGSCV